MADTQLQLNEKNFDIHFTRKDEKTVEAEINGEAVQAQLSEIDDGVFFMEHNNRSFKTMAVEAGGNIHVWVNGETFVFEKNQPKSTAYRPGAGEAAEAGNDIGAPMPGKILKILVKEGQEVAQNERLFIVEAMNMENEVKTPRDGVVKKINFKENDLVSVGETVVELERVKDKG